MARQPKYASPLQSIIWGVVLIALAVAAAYGGYVSNNPQIYVVTVFFLVCAPLCIYSGIKRIKNGEDINNTDYQPEQTSSDKMNQFYESNSELLQKAESKVNGGAMIIAGLAKAIPAFVISLITGFGSIVTIMSGNYTFGNIIEFLVWGICIFILVTQIRQIIRGIKELRGESDN